MTQYQSKRRTGTVFWAFLEWIVHAGWLFSVHTGPKVRRTEVQAKGRLRTKGFEREFICISRRVGPNWRDFLGRRFDHEKHSSDFIPGGPGDHFGDDGAGAEWAGAAGRRR